MKKLVLALAIFGLSSAAFAAPILCGATPSLGNGTGSGTINCAGFDAGVGFHITSLTVIRSADASTTLSGVPVVTFTWGTPTGSFAGALGQIFTLTSLGGVGSGFTPNPSSPQTATFAATPGQTTTAFSVAYTSAVVSGTLTSSSGVVLIDFTSAADVIVPEPMTMSLMGAGLLAIGFLGRRVRRS